ncbi:autotransporter-associated beta strand repeat-containing protein [Sphingomonas radiodurans]|uniref:autotransporter-associated beta strand repeat-containing protein n=1 Tax=Sphingomonas radiodurans TaxID=2890321 RepID=UPI001E3D0C3A|nr:autotransporter-associated beta strand repeat-containing protein [Sphingomonas radiodurans]WBH14990.1 autotransporter-associated beta strand repeat-containing protein [Sphingomonas radiodurans]
MASQRAPTNGHRLARRGLLIALMAGSALAGTAQAQTWTGAVDDDYANGANWSGGVVPVPAAGPAVVAINTTAVAPVVDAGDIVTGKELRIGAFGPATLTVRNGGSLTAASTTVGGSLDGGSNADADGTLLISGAGTQVSAGRLLAAFGDGSVGTISVTGGGVLNSASGEIGNRLSIGAVTVSGAGSQWNVESGVRLGTGIDTGSRGSLTILDGGVMTLGVNSALTVTDGSVLRVSGANSRIDGAANSQLTLERSTTGGTLLLENGGVISVESAAFGNTSDLTIRNGARLELSGGSTTFNETARVLVTGVGSRLTSGGNFGFNANGIGADVVFEDGAIVTSTANVNSALSFGGNRRLIVRSGAQFNLTGGSAASFSIGGGTLDVSDASVSFSGGLITGNGGGNNTVILRNADFVASSVTLNGANDRLIVGADVGQAAATAGIFDVDGNIGVVTDATLVLNYTGNPITIEGPFSRDGTIRHLAGDTRLTGFSNQWRGITDLSGGSLAVDNLFGDSSGPITAMNVSGGAILSGRGTIGGVVSVADGTIRPGGDPVEVPEAGTLLAAARVSAAAASLGGEAVGTLTFTGPLALSSASRLEYQLGAPTGTAGTDSDLINVSGNLTLDGTLDVTDTGGFGAGLYRLFNYGGALTDNGLVVGATPTGFVPNDLTVQTSVASQVNLLVGTPVGPSIFNFWDGANTTANNQVDGGTGTWSAGRINWTNAAGTANGRYNPNATLIFAGAGGVVTIDNSSAPGVDSPQVIIFDTNQLAPTGLQFASTGYRVQGGDLSFGGGAGIATVRVGDGTAAGAAINATIASNLILANRLDKIDLGTLTLTGQNLFIPDGGRSRVLGGTLEIAGGGQMLTGGLDIALAQAATFRVTGAGSIASVGTGISTGSVTNGPGTIEVLDGGTLRDSERGGNGFGTGSLVRVSGAGSILDLANNSTSQGSFLVENGGLARVAPIAFSSTGSLVVRSGGRIEPTRGDTTFGSGPFVVTNGLIQGAGSAFNSVFALSIAPAIPTNPAANFIVEDGSSVTVNTNTNSGLGFDGPISTLDIRSGASFTLTGGTDAGLSIENSRLTVDNATLSIGGALLGGQRFGNNTVILRNADVSARQVELRAATDRIVIGGNAGEAATEAGRFNVGQVSLGNAATSLILNHTSTGFTIGSEFQGAGAIRHMAGDTRLTGSSPFWGGTTQLTGGSLAVDGVFGGAAHQLAAVGGAVLSGQGAVGGAVTVTDGTIRPGGDALNATGALLGGNSVGTLTVGGPLVLGATSRLAFQLGAPDTPGIGSDLINVTGDLTLDGTLDVTDAGGFGAGLYRLINYGGRLTDNGLQLGALPSGFDDFEIQTSVARQVNLIVAATPAPTSFPFWDGSATTANGRIDGGSGTWTAANTNWTTTAATDNGAYNPEDLLIFTSPTAGEEAQGQRLLRVSTQVTAAVPSASAGTVTVDDSAGAITLENGMQFAVTGYTLNGDDIVLAATTPCGECTPLPGQTIVRVGDGTDASTGFVATIRSRLIGESGLLKTDRGTLIMSGANSYSGGTEVADGKLQGDATSLQGDIAIGGAGTLLFTQAADGEYAGTLSGSGVFAKQGTGKLRLSADSSGFDGTSVLTGGELAVDGTLGSALSTVQAGGAATLSGAGRIGGSVAVDDATVSPGGLPVPPPVDTVFTAAALAEATGSVGLLTIDGDLSLTTASILAFQLGDPAGLAGVAGDLINVGGSLTLDGTLNVRDAGGFGAGLYRLINYGGTLADNGLDIGLTPTGFASSDFAIQTTSVAVNLLVVAPVSSFTFWDGTDAGANGVAAGGAGTWTNAATNWTTADGTRNGAYDPAALLIFAGAPGAVTIDNSGGQVAVGVGAQFAVDGYSLGGGGLRIDGAETVFRVGDGTNASTAYVATIGSAISGAGGLVKTDRGTLVLTGANSYTGGTAILGGTVRSSAATIGGPVAIAGAGTLQFEQPGDGGFAGVLSGDGSVRKTGAGTLSLTGDSRGFAGGTTIEAGTLVLTGQLGGTTSVGSGATLTGNGTLGGLDVAGRVSPGTGAATLNVAGNLVFRGGSTYAVDLAAAGGADRIAATGTARLEGGTVAITTLDPETDYRGGSLYRILDAAAGLSGTFGGLTEQSAFLDFALEYDLTGASVRVAQIRTFPDVALTFNQRQAAGALKDLERTAGSDSLDVYNTLLMLDASAARAAFDASSGEIYATLLATEERGTLDLANRFTARGNAAIGEGFGIWGGVTGEVGHVDGDGNGGRIGHDGAGGEIGIDYRGPDNEWAVGIGGGWQSGGVDLPSRGSHAETDTWHIGGYARYGSGGAGFTAYGSAVHAATDAKATRTIAFGTLARSARADADMRTTAIGGGVRYGLSQGNLSLGPTIGVDYASSSLDGFREEGAGALNLSAGRNRDGWARYGGGGFVRMESARGQFDLTARFVTGARNDAGVFLDMAGSSRRFEVRAARGSASGAQVHASGRYDLGGYWTLGGQAGMLAAGSERYVSGSIRLGWTF